MVGNCVGVAVVSVEAKYGVALAVPRLVEVSGDAVVVFLLVVDSGVALNVPRAFDVVLTWLLFHWLSCHEWLVILLLNMV